MKSRYIILGASALLLLAVVILGTFDVNLTPKPAPTASAAEQIGPTSSTVEAQGHRIIFGSQNASLSLRYLLNPQSLDTRKHF